MIFILASFALFQNVCVFLFYFAFARPMSRSFKTIVCCRLFLEFLRKVFLISGHHHSAKHPNTSLPKFHRKFSFGWTPNSPPPTHTISATISAFFEIDSKTSTITVHLFALYKVFTAGSYSFFFVLFFVMHNAKNRILCI